MADTIAPRERAVYEVLAQLEIPYERHAHPPVATVEEAEAHWVDLDAVHCKNLFLRNKKGDRHYLVVIEHRKQADLRRLAGQLGDDRLSFGSPERLARHLGLEPGAVSPFGLINDREHRVRLVLDVDLKAARRVAFHPNVNTATVVLDAADFFRFLEWSGHAPTFVTVSQ
jgi:Ala-tRNA(Pro) deacylase